jgi:hypothetical protein
MSDDLNFKNSELVFSKPQISLKFDRKERKIFIFHPRETEEHFPSQSQEAISPNDWSKLGRELTLTSLFNGVYYGGDFDTNFSISFEADWSEYEYLESASKLMKKDGVIHISANKYSDNTGRVILLYDNSKGGDPGYLFSYLKKQLDIAFRYVDHFVNKLEFYGKANAHIYKNVMSGSKKIEAKELLSDSLLMYFATRVFSQEQYSYGEFLKYFDIDERLDKIHTIFDKTIEGLLHGRKIKLYSHFYLFAGRVVFERELNAPFKEKSLSYNLISNNYDAFSLLDIKCSSYSTMQALLSDRDSCHKLIAAIAAERSKIEWNRVLFKFDILLPLKTEDSQRS